MPEYAALIIAYRRPDLIEKVLGGLAALFDPRLSAWVNRETTPPSYDAYVEFVAGQEAYWADNGPEALPSLHEPSELPESYTRIRENENPGRLGKGPLLQLRPLPMLKVVRQ